MRNYVSFSQAAIAFARGWDVFAYNARDELVCGWGEIGARDWRKARVRRHATRKLARLAGYEGEPLRFTIRPYREKR